MVLSAGPDASTLLSTALEKLLYLESRLEAAESAREESARVVDRLREASAQVRRTLNDWQRRATHAEVAAEGAEREAGLLRAALEKARAEQPEPVSDSEIAVELKQAQARLERFETERELWLDRMVMLGRLRSDSDDDLDLGSFIAELRAEVMALRRGETDRLRVTIADRPAPPDAQALLESLPERKPDAEVLVQEARLPRSQRTLALLCARDLESDAASVRRRSVERLAEAEIGALNALAVEHSKTEPDAWVRSAIIRLIDRTGGEAEGLVIDAALYDPDARVRVAAVEALARRGVLDWERALSDGAPAVRRRVLALLPRAAWSLDIIDSALRDDDASVRRVAVLALSTRPGPEAVALLQSVAASEDEAVRTAACEMLARRGLQLQRPPVVLTDEPSADQEPCDVAPFDEVLGDVEPDSLAFKLDERVMEEVRAALRGRSAEELEALLEVTSQQLAESTERLVAAGTAVWRGPKLYAA